MKKERFLLVIFIHFLPANCVKRRVCIGLLSTVHTNYKESLHLFLFLQLTIVNCKKEVRSFLVVFIHANCEKRREVCIGPTSVTSVTVYTYILYKTRQVFFGLIYTVSTYELWKIEVCFGPIYVNSKNRESFFWSSFYTL